MKIFDIRKEAQAAKEGEYVLGLKDLNTHACYMIYGILAPGEKGRLIKPGKGHEEIVLAAKGDLVLTGARTGMLKEGSAFHIVGTDECHLENPGTEEALYIVAGGHSAGGHSHAH